MSSMASAPASSARYVPGLSADVVARRFGVRVTKLASNESCLGPSHAAVAALAGVSLLAYPDDDAAPLRAQLAARHGVTPDAVAAGNGSTELISLAARALVEPGRAALYAWPSFIWYRMALERAGRRGVAVPLDASLDVDVDAVLAAVKADAGVQLVFAAVTNNPTGRALDEAALDALVAGLPADVILVLDDAYAEYRAEPDAAVRRARARPRTLALRTFSKAHGLAALRVGYAVGDRALVAALERVRDPFHVNQAAQAAACASLADEAHVEAARAHNAEHLPRLAAGLVERGFAVTPSAGNFVLARVPASISAAALADALLARGVIVRTLPGYDLPDALRITTGTDADHARLFAAIDEILGLRVDEQAPARLVDGARKAPATI